MLLQQLLLVLLAAGAANAYVFSCDETKNHLVNRDIFHFNTTYLCVIAEEGFNDWSQLAKLTVNDGTSVHYFSEIAKSASTCITRTIPDLLWKINGLQGLQSECKQEFTVIFTTDTGGIYAPLKKAHRMYLNHQAITLVVPQTGIKLRTLQCTGSGIVTIYAGAGNSVAEQLYELGSWSCADIPNWFLSFDSVLSIHADTSDFEFQYSNDLTPDSKITASHGDDILVFTSGKADEVQNVAGGLEHRACIEMKNSEAAQVTANLQLEFDTKNQGSVVLQKNYQGSEFDQSIYYNGTYVDVFTTEYLEVRYVPSRKQPIDIGKSNDNIFVHITIGSDGPAPVTTTTTATTTSPTPASSGVYCNCAVDKFGFSSGWNSNDIWLDIVVVLDTSEAMGAESLEDARELIESFISDGEVDFLITDSLAPFYTRVGVISMTDSAEILYNLNMTKADKVHASIKKGLSKIDIKKAFDAASNMLKEGASQDRANARQVIYYMSDSNPKSIQDSITKFKNTGVIIVNNFLKDGEAERSGLKDLASEGYYYSSTNYLAELQSFCKANCFCAASKSAYGDSDAATQASGGCYHPVTAGVPFNKAKTACADDGGIIATIHDDKKGQFVQQLVSKAKSDYFWIGYEKSTTGVWQWEDQSTDPYTHWDVNEPSTAAVSKCAYVDTTHPKSPWGAGNCQLGFPYVCQFAPCSVGNKKC